MVDGLARLAGLQEADRPGRAAAWSRGGSAAAALDHADRPGEIPLAQVDPFQVGQHPLHDQAQG